MLRHRKFMIVLSILVLLALLVFCFRDAIIGQIQEWLTMNDYRIPEDLQL